MKVNFTADINVESLSAQAINNAIQKEVSNTVKSFNIDTRINREFDKKAAVICKNAIEDGRFIERLSKEISKQINLDVIIEKLDTEKISEMVAAKIAATMISKLK